MIEGEPWRTAINMLRQKTLVGLPTDVVQHHALFRQTQNISHARTPLDGGGKGQKGKAGKRTCPSPSSLFFHHPFLPPRIAARKNGAISHLPIYPFPLLPFSLSSRRVRLYLRLLHCRLGCRETGNGHTIRRATDIVQLSFGAHLDGRGVA